MDCLKNDIFFIHLPKTAGTTVVRMLEQHFGSSNSCPLPTHQGADEQPFQNTIHSPRPLIISGHPDHLFHLWALAWARTGPKDIMTFLRHPVDRFLSMFFFITRSKYVQKHVKTCDLSLEDAASGRDSRLAPNLMTKSLCSLGKPREYTQSVRPEELPSAIENLKKMSFFGLSEEFNLSYVLMAHTLGFTPRPITKWNVNTPYPQKHELPSRIIRKIMIQNMVDLELYQFAHELFQLKISESAREIEPLARSLQLSDHTYMVKQFEKNGLISNNN